MQSTRIAGSREPVAATCAAPHIVGMSETDAALKIMLNGQPRAVPIGLSVAGLLDTLGLDRRKVAVERNEAIVSRSAYDQTAIADGDQFEIVHFIGGG